MKNGSKRKHFRLAVCSHCHNLVKATILTITQGVIAEGLVRGKTTKEMAEELFVSVKTIEAHRKAVYEATGTKNIAQLCKWAYEHGLLEVLDWSKEEHA